MTGDDVRRFRERRGLSRAELAQLLNESLDKNYSADTIGRWERGADGRKPPKWVVAFLEEASLSELADGIAAGGLEADDQPLDTGTVDSAPGGAPLEAQPPIMSGRGALTRACEELWELIATGVGMIGAATGNEAIMQDGAIIAADKAALGAAWGKLAETNETFRRMLLSMTEGGAWLQVAMVTGTTVSKCWQNHAAYDQWRREQQRAGDGAAEPVYDAAA